MAIFNSYVSLPEGTSGDTSPIWFFLEYEARAENHKIFGPFFDKSWVG